jgi:hypothetical protein
MADSRPVLDAGDLHVLNVVQRQMDTATDSIETRIRRIEAALSKLGVDFNRQFARLMQASAVAPAPVPPKKTEEPETDNKSEVELVNPEEIETEEPVENAEKAAKKVEKKVEAVVRPRRHRWL